MDTLKRNKIILAFTALSIAVLVGVVVMQIPELRYTASYSTSEAIAEICDNLLDDDADTLVDCEDFDCAEEQHCQEEICDNKIDDDLNTLIDCEDYACAEFCVSSSSTMSTSSSSSVTSSSSTSTSSNPSSVSSSSSSSISTSNSSSIVSSSSSSSY